MDEVIKLIQQAQSLLTSALLEDRPSKPEMQELAWLIAYEEAKSALYKLHLASLKQMSSCTCGNS